MDIDVVEENVDTDLEEFMAVLRRDERLEIEETNREIMAVLKSLGAATANTDASASDPSEPRCRKSPHPRE